MCYFKIYYLKLYYWFILLNTRILLPLLVTFLTDKLCEILSFSSVDEISVGGVGQWIFPRTFHDNVGLGLPETRHIKTNWFVPTGVDWTFGVPEKDIDSKRRVINLIFCIRRHKRLHINLKQLSSCYKYYILHMIYIPITLRVTFRCSFLPSRVAVQAYSPSSGVSKLRKIKSKPRPSLLCSTYTLKVRDMLCCFINALCLYWSELK